MKHSFLKKNNLLLILFLFVAGTNYAQIDSIVINLKDTIVSKLILDDIPKKTFKDKLMYPHRWYVKQLLKPKVTDFDTTYILSNKRKLTLALPIAKKFYGFNLNDIDNNNTLKFSPNTYYHVGFNFSNIILTFGFYPGIRFGAKPNHGKTISRDLQVTIIGRRVITDINYQNYKGFYLYNSSKYFENTPTPDSLIIRSDIKVVSYGVNTMFVFNYKKYSLRGAFSFTDIQRKKAGSFMTGLYHSNVTFSSNDSSFVNYSLKKYFSTVLTDIKKISVMTIGLNAGYGYTYVYKKIIFSTALNVGVGGQKTNYTTIDDKEYVQSFNLSIHVNAKAALRYDNLRFFTGVLANYDNNFTFNSKLFNTENYIAKIVCFVGYRFNIKQNGRKVLKAMGLIDYNN